MRLNKEQIKELGRDCDECFLDLKLVNRCENFIENYSETYSSSHIALEIRLEDTTIGYIKGDMYNIRRMNRAGFSKIDMVNVADVNSNFDTTCMYDLVNSINKNIKNLDGVAFLDFIFCENENLRKLLLDNINGILEDALNVDMDYVFISTIKPENIDVEIEGLWDYDNISCNRTSDIDESAFLKKLGFNIVAKDSYAWKKRQ